MKDLPVTDRVSHAISADPRIDIGDRPLVLGYEDGVLTIEGEVPDIAAKRRILEVAAALPVVTAIVDRLRVEPASRMSDEEILVHVRDALLEEPAFARTGLRLRRADRVEVVADPAEPLGCIEVRVDDGVVTLDGEVPSLSHKRLAGVLAWWVPGSRDVINGLGVEPPEEDNDDEITDAVRLVLEKDPFVDATQVRVSTHNGIVTLEGDVPTDGERQMAEHDAWYVFGVDDVVNRIIVEPRA